MISEVFNEDCMAGMARYPDGYFGLAIIDPPYGIGEDGSKNHTRSGIRIGAKFKGGKSFVKANKYKPYLSGDISPNVEYFKELRRVSKNQIIWGANHFISKIPYDSPAWIVWDKANGETDFADCEIAWTSFDRSVRKFEFKWNGFLQGNMKQREERLHPNQKPVALYKWLLANYAKPGDRILDTHLGSGSSRIAAWDMGFDFYGWELDQDYFAAMEKRFEAHIAKPALFTAEEMYRPEQVKLFQD